MSSVYQVQQGKHSIQYLLSDTISIESSMVTEFEAMLCDYYGLILNFYRMCDDVE